MSQFVVGLTGGIGSGKSTVSAIFEEFGIDIIDADIVARRVVEPGTPALMQIEQHFGSDYITTEGTLNRTKLRSLVFSNNEAKTWLNELLHPLIRKTLLADIEASTSPYSILVAPLLIENKLTRYVNRVLVVDIDERTQLARTVKRDPSSEDEVKSIIASQTSRENRRQHADDIVDNSLSDLSQLKQKLQNLHRLYLEFAGHQAS